MKRIKVFCAFAASFALAIVMCAAAFASDNLEAPSFAVISPTASATEMSVSWWDSPNAKTGCVQYATESFDSSAVPEDVLISEGFITRQGTGYTAFEAVITGLDYGATYYYRVGSEERWSEVKSFRLDGDGASFMYLGDVQYGSAATADQDYRAWGDMIAGAYERHPDIGFGLIGGDLVDNGRQANQWQRFFSEAARVFGSLPMLTVPGNHESNASGGTPRFYLDVTAMPQNGPAGFTEEFYSCDYGDFHITALSSNIFSGEHNLSDVEFESIAEWIADDIAESNAKWKIVVMHHPAYVVVPDAVSAGVLANWTPIFEEQQVDLVLCGHQHVYMRTEMINGVTYVMGNSGAKHYQTAYVPYAAEMIGDVSTYQIIQDMGSTLQLTCYDAEGAALDSVSLTLKDRTAAPEEPEETYGDINRDGIVDKADLSALISAIQTRSVYSKTMDLNNDGKINICDAHMLALQIAA